MSPEKIEDLVQKYLNGTSTAEERELLDSWYRSQLAETHEWEAESLDEVELVKAKMFNVIKERIAPNRSSKFIPNFYRYVAAASVIMVIATSAFFFYRSSQIISSDSIAIEQVIIAPGRNGAILTLGNGKEIALGNHPLTHAEKANMAEINEYSDSLLKYKSAYNKTKREIITNTLTTLRGHKFTVVLSDSTKVFMNAGSTLQYPEIFTGSERIVTLTGEAYFEVAHNSKAPFKVQVRGQIIEDLGTSFNVSAYKDELFVSVTLVEGLAKIKKGKNEVIINPGQNALTTEGNSAISIKLADLESDLAWRSDLFHFQNVPLSEVLKQIARWYNLEIEYEGSIPTKTIDGEIYKNINGAQILTILKNLGVNFKLDGNKLIIENR